jgi:predicted transcriptional regulator
LYVRFSSDSLHNALVRLSSNDLQEMPVLSNEENKVIGIITISDLVTLYDKEVEKITKIMNRSNINTKNDEMNNEFKNKPVDSKK